MPDVHVTLSPSEVETITNRLALGQTLGDWLREAARARIVDEDVRRSALVPPTHSPRCAHCAELLRKPRRGPMPVYCGDRCRKRAALQRRRETAMTADQRKQEAGRRLQELATALDDAGISLDGPYAGLEVDEVELDGETYVQDVAIVSERGTRYRRIAETIVVARQLADAVEAVVYDLDGAELGRRVEPLPLAPSQN